jgi:hypothetical protein
VADPAPRGLQLVAAEGARDPRVVDLARLLSIAVQIEPELVRAMRLSVLRDTDAGVEADLWFSPLVAARDPDGIAFLPDVAEALQKELAQPSYEQQRTEARKTIESLHAGHSPMLLLEEAVTYHAVSAEEDAYTRMELEIGRAVAALESSSDDVIARWAARTLPRMPDAVRTSEPAIALARRAGKRLGGIKVRGVIEAGETGADWDAQLLARLPTVAVGIALTSTGLEISHPPAPGAASSIDVPHTEPLVLEAATPTPTGWQPRRISWKPGTTVKADVIIGPVLRITTATGNMQTLRLNMLGRQPILYAPGAGGLREIISREAHALEWAVVWMLADIHRQVTTPVIDAYVLGPETTRGDLFNPSSHTDVPTFTDHAYATRAEGLHKLDESERGVVADRSQQVLVAPVGDSRLFATDLRRALIELDIARARVWIDGKTTADRRPSEPVPREGDEDPYEVWLRFAPKPRPLASGEKWHVFISYRSINRLWALHLHDVLCDLDYKVFLDRVELTPGDDLVSGSHGALDGSQAGVLIWSETAAADSAWIERESAMLKSVADNKTGFAFVTARLDSGALPRFAEGRVSVDFSAYPDGPNGGALLHLLHALANKPMDQEAAVVAAQQDEVATAESGRVAAAIVAKDAGQLLALFKNGGTPWRTSSVLGCKAAEGLRSLGRYDEALTLSLEHEARFPNAIRAKQLHALILAGRDGPGDLDGAQAILGALYERDERDPETLAIYARTWMNRYAKSGDAADLEQSRDLYVEAFAGAPDDYYFGINAAAKSALLGGEDDMRRAEEYAAAVQRIVGTEPKPEDYWMTATSAEALLIQRQYPAAARLFQAAVHMSPSMEFAVQSTWTHVCGLMARLKPADDERAAIRRVFAHLPDCADVDVPAEQLPRRGGVFISYAPEDRSIAETIAHALEAAGLDVFLDRQQPQAGDDFAKRMEESIHRSDLFIPVLSRHSLTHDERYFRKEWNAAFDKASRLAESAHYIFPVAIDDLSFEHENLPTKLRELNWYRLADGRMDEFVRAVTDRYRSNRRGAMLP